MRFRRMMPAVALALWTCSSPSMTADAPVVLAASGAGNPTAAAAADGAAYVAWIETRDSVSNVYVAHLDPGSHGPIGQRGAPRDHDGADRGAVPLRDGTVSAVRVNDIPGDAAPHEQAPPQVVTGPDGAVYVVWQNNLHVPGRRFPSSNLRFARSADGGRTFEPAVFVNDDADGPPSSHTFQDVEVGADGTIYVSWIDGRERTRAEAAMPEAAHGGHGGMHGDARLPGSQVRVAKSTDGGRTFSGGVVVFDDVCPCCRTTLAVSGSRVALAFRSAENNVRDMVVVVSEDGGETFGAPIRVHDDGWSIDACPHAGASLAWTEDGRLHIAWYTGAETRQGLWYARSSAGGTSFDAPQPLLTGGWVPVSQVKLAADGRDVWIAWDDRREATAQVMLAVARDGRVRPQGDAVTGRSPAIAAGSAVVLAWQDGERAAARVLRRR